MLKKLFAIVLGLIIVLFAVGSVSAKPGKINIKGEVKAVGDGTLMVESHKGDTYVISVPDGIVTGIIQVGDLVLVKATTAEDGTWVAETIKQYSKGKADADDSEGKGADDAVDWGKPVGVKDNSAFCAAGKQEIPHPLAPKLAARFGVTEEWVMDHFCDGYSIGAIMLAIKTSQMDEMTATSDDLLFERAGGTGWGLIWKGLGLIGSEKLGQSPPGLLKKPVFAGPK